VRRVDDDGDTPPAPLPNLHAAHPAGNP